MILMRCSSQRRRWCRRRVLRVCLSAIGLVVLYTIMLPMSSIDRMPRPIIEHRAPAPDFVHVGLFSQSKLPGAEGGVEVVANELPLVRVSFWRNCEKILKHNEPEIIAAVHSNYTGADPLYFKLLEFMHKTHFTLFFIKFIILCSLFIKSD